MVKVAGRAHRGDGEAAVGLRSGRRIAVLAAAALALTFLQGCSDVPDWANPVHWYHSTVGLVTGDDDEAPPPQPMSPQTQAMAKTAASEPATTPNLANVPPRPTISPTAARAADMKGLVADRSAAEYTDQTLRAGPSPDSSAATNPPATPSVPPPAPAPAPAAAAIPAAPPVPSASPASPASSTPPAGTAPLGSVATAPVAPLPAAAATPAPAVPAAPAMKPSVAAAQPAAAAPPVAAPSAVAPPAAVAPQPASAEQVYQAQLRASAANQVAGPQSAGFAPSTAAPVGQFATSVPPVVQQSYNAAIRTAGGAATASGAAMVASRSAGAFGAAGSRLGGTVEFSRGSSRLAPGERPLLARLVQDYHRQGGTLRVVGYAAPAESAAAGEGARKIAAFDLADRRAVAVAEALERSGVRPGDVFVEAREMPGPEADAGAAASPDAAQRVEIFLEN